MSAKVKSPCVEICQLDAARGKCIGCHRTLDEIARWSAMREPERAAVLAALPARRTSAETVDAPRG